MSSDKKKSGQLYQLISQLVRNENMTREIDESYKRFEAKNGSDAANEWRNDQMAALRSYDADPLVLPGSDRIQRLCDKLFADTGLTLLNVCTLRAIVCYALDCTFRSSGVVPLDEVAECCERYAEGNPPIKANEIKSFLSDSGANYFMGVPEPAQLISQLRLAKETAKQAGRAETVEKMLKATDFVVAGEKGPRVQRHLAVNVDRRTVALDGQTTDVKSVQAVRWLKVLSDHPDEWISGNELKRLDPELDGVRTDRLKQYLPAPVLALIDSEPGKGSRLRLA
jgi:hypothetical protein